MESFKSIGDVLDYAIEQERKAAEFYTKLAQQSKNHQMSKAFLQFAAEERGHESKLQAVREGKLGELGTTEPEFDMKLADYLVDVQPSDDMSYQDALILAMKEEKAAYKLYKDLAARMSDPNLRRVFEDLAREEAGHKMRFETEYDEVILTDN